MVSNVANIAKILAATDFSEDSDLALDYAKEFAAKFGAEIVLGTHGRTGLAHVLMGSVAERVVQKSPCPVLTVRHPDRKFKHPLDK